MWVLSRNCRVHTPLLDSIHSLNEGIQLDSPRVTRLYKLPQALRHRYRKPRELFIEGPALKTQLIRWYSIDTSETKQSLACLVDKLCNGTNWLSDQANQAFTHAFDQAVRIVNWLERLLGQASNSAFKL